MVIFIYGYVPREAKQKQDGARLGAQHVLLGHLLTESIAPANLHELCACRIVPNTMLPRMEMGGWKIDIPHP